MPLFSPVSSIFTVPKGYVAILRAFKYALEPQMPTVLRDDMRVSLYVDSIAVENYIGLKLPQVVTDFVPCYVIGDENQIIKITIGFLTNIVSPPGAAIGCYVELYGNLLLKTGVPTVIEPGNDPVIVKPYEVKSI